MCVNMLTRGEHNVTCQLHLSQHKRMINKRQVTGAGQRACSRGSGPADLGLRDRLPSSLGAKAGLDCGSAPRFCEFRDVSSQSHARKYLSSRRFAVLNLACPVCSSRPCFCPHVPTSGDPSSLQGPPARPGSPRA